MTQSTYQQLAPSAEEQRFRPAYIEALRNAASNYPLFPSPEIRKSLETIEILPSPFVPPCDYQTDEIREVGIPFLA